MAVEVIPVLAVKEIIGEVILRNAGSGIAFSIEPLANTGAIAAFDLLNTANPGMGARIYSNSATGGQPLLLIHADNQAYNSTMLSLNNDGLGMACRVDNSTLGTNPAMEIAHSATNAADTAACSIISNNAGAGAPIGIDLSTFAGGEALFKIPADLTPIATSTTNSTGRIAVDIGGVISYVPYFT